LRLTHHFFQKQGFITSLFFKSITVFIYKIFQRKTIFIISTAIKAQAKTYEDCLALEYFIDEYCNKLEKRASGKMIGQFMVRQLIRFQTEMLLSSITKASEKCIRTWVWLIVEVIATFEEHVESICLIYALLQREKSLNCE